MGRWLLRVVVSISALLALATIGLMWWSFRLPEPGTIAATQPTSVSAPLYAIQMPIPSDAEEYLVPLHGNVEHWEYAQWENKWYRGMGVPLALPAVLFLIGPVVYLMRALGLRRARSGCAK